MRLEDVYVGRVVMWTALGDIKSKIKIGHICGLTLNVQGEVLATIEEARYNPPWSSKGKVQYNIHIGKLSPITDEYPPTFYSDSLEG